MIFKNLNSCKIFGYKKWLNVRDGWKRSIEEAKAHRAVEPEKKF